MKKVTFEEKKQSISSDESRPIDNIRKLLDQYEKQLNDEIEKEEEKLSKIKKNIVVDINMEEKEPINKYPSTKISKRNYKEKVRRYKELDETNYRIKPKKEEEEKTTEIIKPKKENSKISSKSKSSEQVSATPSFIEEVGVIGNVIETYQLDFSYVESRPLREENCGNGVKRIVYRNGDISHVFKNGTRKTNHNGIMYTFFNNGDIMQEFPDGIVSYKYKENDSIEVSRKDGVKLIFFSNGQIHNYSKDGKLRVTYPDGTVQTFPPKK